MTADRAALTTTDLIAAASEVLSRAGYRPVSDRVWDQQFGSRGRLFEDPYGIVAVISFETWGDLSSGWSDAQASLVEFISRHVSKSEPKAWDGYLVLLTPSPLSGEGASDEAASIRYDTNRVRKLVATGEELVGPSDVEKVLIPLLPLGTFEMPIQETTLDALPRLLVSKGIAEQATAAVIAAFANQESLMEQLHAARIKS